MTDDSLSPRQSAGGWETQYAEIATLAGGLAHEIRNPLSTIGLNLELLDEDLESAETPRERRMRQRVHVLQRECTQLERVLDSFLEFTRAGSLELAPAQLNDAVREFIEFFQPQASERQVEIIPHLAAHLPPVRLDSRLFQQVLQNLSRNALQAMPQGGRLELLTYEDQGRVLLEIIDNGVGMDRTTQSRMFDAFFSTKPEGSGLGLPTVKKIIEAHGGGIACESEPSRGTRFRLSFPAA